MTMKSDSRIRGNYSTDHQKQDYRNSYDDLELLRANLKRLIAIYKEIDDTVPGGVVRDLEKLLASPTHL